MKWTNKGHEFDSIAEKICNSRHEFIIWGAGTFGEAFFNEFCNEISIVGFVDSNIMKQGLTKCNREIWNPSVLESDKRRIVLVSTGWTAEVFASLEKMGYEHGYNYFHIDEFITIYRMYKKNELCVSNLNVNITEFCSLRCQKCSALNPYIKDKKHYSIVEIEHMLDVYFRWVDNVSILGLVGGDAMTHPAFNEILEMVGEKYYRKSVGNIEVYSNAVILPDKLSVELFKKYDVIYRFTDYGENTYGKQKCGQVANLLKENGIRYDWAKFERWSDCGYPQESNGITSENALQKFYNKCDRRSCQGLLGTKLFYCGMAIGAERTGYCKAIDTDYFELEQEKMNKMELMEFMLGYNEKGYITYCKKCNGGPNINQHFVSPGVQF